MMTCCCIGKLTYRGIDLKPELKVNKYIIKSKSSWEGKIRCRPTSIIPTDINRDALSYLKSSPQTVAIKMYS